LRACLPGVGTANVRSSEFAGFGHDYHLVVTHRRHDGPCVGVFVITLASLPCRDWAAGSHDELSNHARRTPRPRCRTRPCAGRPAPGVPHERSSGSVAGVFGRAAAAVHVARGVRVARHRPGRGISRPQRRERDQRSDDALADGRASRLLSPPLGASRAPPLPSSAERLAVRARDRSGPGGSAAPMQWVRGSAPSR
jgi:hypothetical protein